MFYYFIAINVMAITITITDKLKAIHNKWRIPENTLLLVSALGGSPCMLITMLIIRHKTRKLKFMLGIPIIIVLQCIIAYFLFNYGIFNLSMQS